VLTLGTLAVAQVVMAAPPDNVSFTFPATVTRGTPAQFDATVTDPDGDAIDSYAWDFGDGQSDSGQHVTHTYTGDVLGPKTVTLTAMDANGESASHSETVNVVNTPPIAGIVHAVTPEDPGPCPGGGQNYQVPLVGQQVNFSGATSMDPDNAFDGNGASNIASYLWTGVDSQAGWGAIATYPSAGNHTVTLQVTDSDGGTGSTTDTFRVDSAPVPQFIFDKPTPVVGEQVQFAQFAGDPDGAADPLTYAWDLDGDGQYDDSTSGSPSWAYSTSGVKQVGLCVTDSAGVARRITHPVEVVVNPPDVKYNVAPTDPLPGQATTFTSTSTPTAGKVITKTEWDFDWNGSTFTADAQGTSAAHAFPTAGSKNFALKVTQADPNGDNAVSKIVTDALTVNAPPVAGFTESPRTAYVGDTVTLASTSHDPDGPLVRQDWDLDNDGQFDDANAQVVSAKFNRAKTYPIKLRVTDSKGATATYTDQVVVRSRPLRNFTGVSVNVGSVSFKRYTKFVRIVVTAVRGAKIKVECRGKGCPKAVVHNSRGRPIRFKRFERKLRVGTKLMVTISKPGYLTKQWVYTIRSRRPPVRRVVCRPPGSKRGTRCPTG
jgi:PKD repeat protein